MEAPLLSGPLEDLVEASASPASARNALARLLDERPEAADQLARSPGLAAAVVAVVVASRSLTRLIVQDPGALAVLANLQGRHEADLSGPEALARWKHLELLRIAARDLTGLDQLEVVGDRLSILAEEVLAGACQLAGPGAAETLGVVGMGKLGGSELNYASDVDVVFVGGARSEDDERTARRAMAVGRLSYRVDADLRPEGRDGPLVRSIDSYRAYWGRWAQTWEIQSLIKARPVAGSPKLGAGFEEAAAEALWRRSFGADELREVRTMKARSEELVHRRGLSQREVKRGRGGIRDIEMAVQLLQLVHGRHDPALRVRSTLPAIRELGAAGYVASDDANRLAAAYRYLRTVEHRLQLVEEVQVHTVPGNGEAREHLARVMGYRDGPRSTAVGSFDEDLSRHQATVRSIHERLFFRPLLEAFASLGPEAARPGHRQGPPAQAGHRMAADAASERLRAFGFRDAEATRAAVRELTSGLTRSSRLMQQMLPLLLQWLSEAPDPDLGLLGLRQLAEGALGEARLLTTFRESPEAARRLCVMIGTSRSLLDTVRHNPEMITALGDDSSLERRGREELLELARSSAGWRASLSRRQGGLHRLKQAETLRIAARDLLGLDGVQETGRAITDLAEALVEEALQCIRPPVPIAAIAMGRLGGAEMSYASDLDLLLVFEGRSEADVAAAEASSEALLRLMNGDTPAEEIFKVDPGLRPEGAQGPLARSLQGYRSYYGRWAQTWERQALVRARPVAGDREIGARFMDIVEDFVWSTPLDDEAQREIRRMKARMERERLPFTEDARFHLKLGRGSLSDVEWTAQLLQLRHGVRSTGTLDAIAALEDRGFLGGDDARVLSDSWTFCTRTRDRWHLMQPSGGDALPGQPDRISRLARSLGLTPAELREEYRRVTRRARQAMERLFYGITPGNAHGGGGSRASEDQ